MLPPAACMTSGRWRAVGCLQTSSRSRWHKRWQHDINRFLRFYWRQHPELWIVCSKAYTATVRDLASCTSHDTPNNPTPPHLIPAQNLFRIHESHLEYSLHKLDKTNIIRFSKGISEDCTLNFPLSGKFPHTTSFLIAPHSLRTASLRTSRCPR